MRGIVLFSVIFILAGCDRNPVGHKTVLPIPPVEGLNYIQAQYNNVFLSSIDHEPDKKYWTCRTLNLKNSELTVIRPGCMAGFIPFANGEKILVSRTCTLGDPGDPLDYLIVDNAGNELIDQTLWQPIRPSNSGDFFFAVRNPWWRTGKPNIYSSTLELLHQFELESAEWDLRIMQDTLCVLSDYHKIKIFNLPDFDMLAEYNLTLSDTVWGHKFMGNIDDIYCAVKNRDEMEIVNILNGDSYKLPCEYLDTLYFSKNNDYFYTLETTYKDGCFMLDEYHISDDGLTHTASKDVCLAHFIPGFRGARYEAIYADDEKMIINIMTHLPSSPDRSYDFFSIILRLPLKHKATTPVQVYDGHSWFPDPDGGQIYNIAPSRDKEAVFRVIL